MTVTIDDRTQIDQTIRIFDNFYNVQLIVPSNQYDIVNSFFGGVCDSEKVARNFTAFLFRIAQETQIDVLELLDQLKGAENKLKMNQIISYYLNSLKSKTSLYGVSTVPRPNQPVARNIVQ